MLHTQAGWTITVVSTDGYFVTYKIKIKFERCNQASSSLHWVIKLLVTPILGLQPFPKER